MAGRLRVLSFVVDPAMGQRVREEFSAGGTVTDAVETAPQDTESIDVAVLDTGEWLERARRLRRSSPRPAAVLISSAPESKAVTAALEAELVGGCVPPDWRPGQLLAECQRAVKLVRLRRELEEQRRHSSEHIEFLEKLSGIGNAIAEANTPTSVLSMTAQAVHQVVDLDACAILGAPSHALPLLHLHCHRPMTAAAVRAVRDDCVEVFTSATGNALNEDHLDIQLSGEPITDGEELGRQVHLTRVLIHHEGSPTGVLLVRSPEPTERSRDVLQYLANRVGDALGRVSVQLGDERRRLGHMIASMADGLIMTQQQSDDVLINPAARRLLGIDDDQQVTRVYLKEKLGFYPFDLVAASAESQTPLREDVTIGDKELSSTVSPVRDGTGKLIGVVVVLRDFTETRALARRQTEFVSVVSHELRTPLTSITGAIDIALSEYAGKLNSKQRQYLTMARESCTKLNELVDDILDVARSERGNMPIHFTPIALDRLAHDVVDCYRSAAVAKQIDLKLLTEDRDIRIVGDPERLTQVLNNLLSNAIKFTPTEGLIEVEVFGPSVASNHVGVSVSNNGEPIPEDSRDRIFEKFEQLKDSSTRRVGGTGLGLAISRAIVEAHGGRIWVDSDEDTTKFIFTLPSAPDSVDVPTEAAQEFEVNQTTVPATTGVVLLLDCDRHSSYILKGILMAAGHDVLLAEDADAALTQARNRQPSLIVIRDSQELVDAFDLVEILKHDPDTRKTTVLMLSSTRARGDAIRVGADEFLSLPIDPAEFREMCLRLISDAGSVRSHKILVVDDDPTIRTICCDILHQAGYSTKQAESGVQALAEAKRFRPDLLLMDVMMPELDGFETAERVRAEPSLSMTPIIFLSARGETADKVRAFRIGAEDYVVKPFVAAELVARVQKALERRDRELDASPTTQLPGAGAIEAEIERRLTDEDAAFCYLDLDNLKAFNDYYGYAKADGIIRQIGDVVRDAIARAGSPGDFVGHIAGDDFVFITTIDRVDEVCAVICDAFDRLVPLYYNKIDRERGFIEAQDRYGELRKFPIMTVSLAAVTTQTRQLKSYSELASTAAAGKKLAKSIPGSSYVRDQVVIFGNGVPAKRQGDRPRPPGGRARAADS